MFSHIFNDILKKIGMSNHAREGKNANSAVVVTVTPDDFMKEMKNNSPLCGMYYQVIFRSNAVIPSIRSKIMAFGKHSDKSANR